ncbi:MAG: riboflavin biosynthesis protein RibF [Bacilli bacterium]|nr:riboflavin biosynthesis protein RibF [Bacilli bacterium]
MNVIHLTYPEALPKEERKETVAAIGFFDGIHKGHQRVINTALEKAKQEGKESAVVSFHPHPSVILKKNSEPVRYITTLEEKEAIIREMGIDRLYIITFNEALSKLSPQGFIDHFIVGLNITHLVAGFDYTFGHKGAGNMENITSMAKGRFTTTVVEKLENGNEKVSSTRIRKLLNEGSVHEIFPLLGRYYEATGTVVTGDNRGGSRLGYPTANIDLPKDKYLPKQGVYAVKVKVDGNTYNGMANLGVVPTFVEGRTEPKLEVNIFDFAENIYGKKVTVQFHKYIREEKKFSSVEEIVSQLKRDEAMIREFFAK